MRGPNHIERIEGNGARDFVPCCASCGALVGKGSAVFTMPPAEFRSYMRAVGRRVIDDPSGDVGEVLVCRACGLTIDAHQRAARVQ